MQDTNTLVNYDSLSFYISMGALIISIINSLYLFYQNRFKMKFRYICHHHNEEKTVGGLCFLFSFENLSKNPFSITRIFLEIDGQKYEFQYDKHAIYSSTSNMCGPKETIVTYSKELPLYVEALGAVTGYFRVRTYKNISVTNTPVTIHVWTNRRKRKFRITPNNCNIYNLLGLPIDTPDELQY